MFKLCVLASDFQWKLMGDYELLPDAEKEAIRIYNDLGYDCLVSKKYFDGRPVEIIKMYKD